MGYEEKKVGGGPATGLANDFTSFLQSFMNTGRFPDSRGGVGAASAGAQFNNADPMGTSSGLFNLLNSIVSNPQADAGTRELINKDIERGRNDLRARFGAQGGMAFGTPAAVAEGVYQAEQAPRTAIAMNDMAMQRVQALMPFFQMIHSLSGLGIPQAETTLQPNKWMQGFNTIMDVANTVSNFIPFAGGGDTNSRKPGETVKRTGGTASV